LTYLRLAPYSQYLAKVMNETSQLKPVLVGVKLSDAFSSLKCMHEIRHIHLFIIIIIVIIMIITIMIYNSKVKERQS
jgi:hypothetical protein